jgi:hypothetical protein
MIAASTPFERTLRAICHCIEKIDSDMRAAVMQLDVRNQVLNLEYATSLPEEFKLALDFIKVGPSGRACGAAVFENKDKFVGNIAEDESWAGQHELLKKHQIEAVWSFPLRGAATRIIGALDIYLDQPRSRSRNSSTKKDSETASRAIGVCLRMSSKVCTSPRGTATSLRSTLHWSICSVTTARMTSRRPAARPCCM